MRLRRITGDVTYRNVAATLALVLAAGTGGAYAAVKLAKNSVRSKHIASGQVKRSDLGRNAVNSSRIGDGTVRLRDLSREVTGGATPGTGLQGPAGPQGPAGADGTPGTPGADGAPGTPGEDLSYTGIRTGGPFVRVAVPEVGPTVEQTLGSFEGLQVLGRCNRGVEARAEVFVRPAVDNSIVLGAGGVIAAGNAASIGFALTAAGPTARVPIGATVRGGDGRVHDIRTVAIAHNSTASEPLLGPGYACGFLAPGIERVSG